MRGSVICQMGSTHRVRWLLRGINYDIECKRIITTTTVTLRVTSVTAGTHEVLALHQTPF